MSKNKNASDGRDIKKSGDFSKSVIRAVLVSLVIFTVAVMVVFVVTGGNEPSTLIVSVFGFCGFECGILGWIRTTEEKKEMKKAEAEKQNNAAKVTAETEQE